ncbi:MAG: hypothetical protein QM809_11505 [Gordonia sp. (in: high G+C Gram-positive bacteria)]|uniref:hypothetical protein n=1 Tax=Gordonia sp. (in: high G+C Gram-positive bacteria) TaxID=84139 RepID=UPI0039E48A22
MRARFGVSLRALLGSAPWQDVAALLLDVDADQWSDTDENLATLVDLQTFWLEAEYVKWTTDPSEARRASARAKASGAVVAPPLPVIRPVARRPPAAHAAARARYDELNARYRTDPGSTPNDGRQLPARELMARFGLNPTPVRGGP